MKDEDKSKEELLLELRSLRAEVARTRGAHGNGRCVELSPPCDVFYRAIFEDLTELISRFLPDGTIIFVNDAYCRLYGEAREELIGRSFWHHVPEEDRKSLQAFLASFSPHDTVRTIEHRVLSSAGVVRWLQWTDRAFFNAAGEIVEFQSVGRDITDRKLAEAALRESEEKYRTIFENAPLGLFRSTPEGRFLEVNQALADMLGYDSPQSVVREIHSIADQIYVRKEERQPIVDAQLRSHAVTHHLNRYRRRNGEEIIANLYVKLIRDVDDRPLCLEGIVEDVTDRKQAEEELRSQRNLLDEIFRNSPYVMVLVNKEGRIEDINRAGEVLAGAPREKLLNLRGGEVFRCLNSLGGSGCGRNDACATCPVRTRVIHTLETGAPSHGEKGRLTVLDQDSRPITLDLLISTALVKAKDSEKVLVTFVDFTEARRANEELRRLAEAFKQASEGIVITSPNGTMEYANPAFEKITGYSHEEIIGKSPRLLKSGKHNEGFYEDLWDTLLAGGRWAGRIVNRRKDGAFYTAECSISPVKDRSGAVVNFVWITRDVTKELEMGERLRQAQKMEAIGTLAGGIAHDFNNILSSALGYTELALEDVVKGTDLEHDLQQVYKAGLRAKDLVKQILAFARKREEELKPTKICPLVKEALKLLRSTIPTSIELRQSIQGDFIIMADPVQVHQIVMNLCTNAYHVMEDSGGVLEVSLTNADIDAIFINSHQGLKPGDYLKLSVSDTGAGISPDIMDFIFEPYFTTKEAGEGTGLGLAMVHGIVKSYGGVVTVESELGKGTVFTVYLPITENRDEKNSYKVESLPMGTERVLFVDDELSIATLGAQMLSRLGYRVTIQTGSLEALDLFSSRPNDFDIVISDMTMPHMYGDKLAYEILRIRNDIPIILCTGFTKRVSEEQIAKHGIRALIYKPIARNDLAKTVRRVLDERIP
jgi:PAS domain S-box-containing protein